MQNIEDINSNQLNEIKNIIDNFKNFLVAVLNNLKAYKIAKWIQKYNEYLKYEDTFKQRKKYLKFKRGQIVRVNFGFNLGNELGGTHYAVVMSENDNYGNSNLIVVPLTSKKDKTNFSEKDDRIDIGNEIKDLIYKQLIKKGNILKEELKKINDLSDTIPNDLLSKLEYYNKCINEYKNMKNGSIILTGQIKAISKIRISKPLYNEDFLYGIRLSGTSLAKIEEKIVQLLFKNKLTK